MVMGVVLGVVFRVVYVVEDVGGRRCFGVVLYRFLAEEGGGNAWKWLFQKLMIFDINTLKCFVVACFEDWCCF